MKDDKTTEKMQRLSGHATRQECAGWRWSLLIIRDRVLVKCRYVEFNSRPKALHRISSRTDGRNWKLVISAEICTPRVFPDREGPEPMAWAGAIIPGAFADQGQVTWHASDTVMPLRQVSRSNQHYQESVNSTDGSCSLSSAFAALPMIHPGNILPGSQR
jgi:hypothetical protein